MLKLQKVCQKSKAEIETELGLKWDIVRVGI
jgi:hypothetical protein